MDIQSQAYALPEQVRYEPYCIATYYCALDAGINARVKSAALAVGQTIGTWTAVPGVTTEALVHHLGKVLSVQEIPPYELIRPYAPDEKRHYILRIAFPEINIGDQLPMLVTTLLGNDISTALPVKLLDIELSKEMASALHGPAFGISGLRELTGVYDRPLILNVLKPCTGFPPEAAIERLMDSARGGADVIKDDELLADPSFNRLSERMRLFSRAVQEVYEENGHRALYCANITDRADRMFVHARRAVEIGCDMLMVNVPVAGLGMLQALAADESIALPILAHFAGFNATTEALSAGMSSPLFLGKLMRLGGADAAILPSPYSAYPFPLEGFLEIARMMQSPYYDVAPTMPVPGGGIHPATAYEITTLLGKDIMVDVGGGIQGHPGGTAAGVQALQAAVSAAVNGQALAEKAAQSPALAQALAAWKK